MVTGKKETLKESMDKRRDLAISADNLEIAEWIWEKITEKFESFLTLVLPSLKYISISVTENELGLKIDVSSASRSGETENKELSESIILSEEMIDNLDQIMNLVMGIAKANGISGGYCDPDDDPYYNEDDVWIFMWHNSKR